MAFREAGAAFVRLFVKKDELSAGLKGAEAEVKKSAERMQTTAERGGIGAIGRGIKDWARPLKTFQTSITSTIGIVTGLLGTLSLIGAAIAAATAGVFGLYRAFTAASREAREMRAATQEAARAAIEAAKANDPRTQRDPVPEKLTEAAVAAGAQREVVENKLKAALKRRDEYVSSKVAEFIGSGATAGAGPLASQMIFERRKLEESNADRYFGKEIADLKKQISQLVGANVAVVKTADFVKTNDLLRESIERNTRDAERIREAVSELGMAGNSRAELRIQTGLLKRIADKSEGVTY